MRDRKNLCKDNNLITDFITDKSVLNLSAVEVIAFVSFGKQDPPYAGPALKKRPPILLSRPIPIEISSTFIPVFSHKFAISLMNEQLSMKIHCLAQANGPSSILPIIHMPIITLGGKKGL